MIQPPQTELETQLIKLYRDSTTKIEFQQKVFNMSKDPELVEWATSYLYSRDQSQSHD